MSILVYVWATFFVLRATYICYRGTRMNNKLYKMFPTLEDDDITWRTDIIYDVNALEVICKFWRTFKSFYPVDPTGRNPNVGTGTESR